MDLFKPNQPYTPKVSIDITDIAELNRWATAAKGNDWDTALACLFRAKELMENQYQDFPQRLRLPLFLQQAGEERREKMDDIDEEYMKSNKCNPSIELCIKSK